MAIHWKPTSEAAAFPPESFLRNQAKPVVVGALICGCEAPASAVRKRHHSIDGVLVGDFACVWPICPGDDYEAVDPPTTYDRGTSVMLITLPPQ